MLTPMAALSPTSTQPPNSKDMLTPLFAVSQPPSPPPPAAHLLAGQPAGCVDQGRLQGCRHLCQDAQVVEPGGGREGEGEGEARR